jgi:predicted transcriptional regulator
MLGVRLGTEVERRLERFARQHRRAKSDIARAAIGEYLDRHSLDDELERQLRACADKERRDRRMQQEIDEAEALAWKTIGTL